MQKPYFHWKRLIKKYSRPMRLHIHEKGNYDGGIYLEGAEEIQDITGACIAMKRPSMNDSGGNYAKEDKHLYLLQPIPHALEDVKVECDGQMYAVTTDRDHGNEPFTGVYAYYLTWVSKFDEKEPPTEVIQGAERP